MVRSWRLWAHLSDRSPPLALIGALRSVHQQVEMAPFWGSPSATGAPFLESHSQWQWLER